MYQPLVIDVERDDRASLHAIGIEWNRRDDDPVPHDLEVIDRDVRLQRDACLQPVPSRAQLQLVTNLCRDVAPPLGRSSPTT